MVALIELPSHPMLCIATGKLLARGTIGRGGVPCPKSCIMKIEGFVSSLPVIQPAYSEKQFEELIKKRLPGRSQSVLNGE